jgi:FkbH-like protein
LDDYLKSLDLHLELAWTDTPHIPRVGQLTRKTNQFNLTTHRYSDQEIEGLVRRDDAFVVHTQLGDRFGDHGLTGVVILRQEGRALRIDTFLLSCRVLGRQVEDAMAAWLVRFAETRGLDDLVGEYIQTAKNQQTKDFYRRLGFEPTAEAGLWRWPIGHPAPPYPGCIRVNLPDSVEERA